MKKKVNDKFPLMENVALVERAMIKRQWNKSALSKESGVSSAVITRFFQDGKISSENLFILYICKLFLDKHIHL